MSPTNATPRRTRPADSHATRDRNARRPLLYACAVLLTAAPLLFDARAASARPPQGKNVNVNVNANSQPGQQRQQALLSLKAAPPSLTLCPGRRASVRLTPKPTNSAFIQPGYSWKVSGGTLNVGPGFADWDLSGAKPGTYTAIVIAQTSQLSAVVHVSAVAKVTVRACPTPTPDNTPTPLPGTTDPAKPTPTPTPTAATSPTPTPTPSSSPSPSPSPAVALNASPTAPPSSSPAPAAAPDVQGASGNRWWLIPATAVAAIALAFLLTKLLASKLGLGFMRDLAGGRSGSPDSGSASTVDESDVAGTGAVVVGGLKKTSDKVHCTVFAPEAAAPGDPFVVQVFAHLAKQAGRLAALAAKAQESAEGQGSAALSGPVARGTEITFRLRMEGLKVREPKKSLVWDGEVNGVQFAVDVPEDFGRTNVRGEVRIYYGEGKAPVGEIMFMFKVARDAGAARAPHAPAAPPQRHTRYTHAFVSYCSKDLDKVLLAVRGLREGWEQEGMTYFLDRRAIRPGESWRAAIKTNLDRCDLFVLFWSSAAQLSGEVKKEIDYALARKGGGDDNPPAIEPFTIEKPVPVPLPAGLETLHFGDELLNYMGGAKNP